MKPRILPPKPYSVAIPVEEQIQIGFPTEQDWLQVKRARKDLAISRIVRARQQSPRQETEPGPGQNDQNNSRPTRAAPVAL